VTTTHINHLTPRVLDIDDLYISMQQRGVEMIDRIQGPPRVDGPEILLRQTSFRALAEPRDFREADGRVQQGALRVRFGEVEARGIALTPAGRDLYEQMVRAVDEQMSDRPEADRQAVAAGVWEQQLPRTEEELCLQSLGYFTYRVDPDAVKQAIDSETAVANPQLADLVRLGVLVPEPIVYEDFLPQSAAGIFASNLTGGGSMDERHGGAERTLEWMSDAVGAEVRVPEVLYAEESERSIVAAEGALTDQLAPARKSSLSPLRITR
jgi:uncharacterized glyoxalase superfamily metalloenzyme YdcJ